MTDVTCNYVGATDGACPCRQHGLFTPTTGAEVSDVTSADDAARLEGLHHVRLGLQRAAAHQQAGPLGGHFRPPSTGRHHRGRHGHPLHHGHAGRVRGGTPLDRRPPGRQQTGERSRTGVAAGGSIR